MSATVCIRCGKERIFARRWTEKFEGKGTLMTSEIYVCPDAECQKIVEAKFAEMRQRRVDSENRKNNLHLKKSQPAIVIKV